MKGFRKHTPEELQHALAAEYQVRARNDFMAFVGGLYLPNGDRFGRCMTDFQRETFELLAPAMVAVRGGEKAVGPRRFWIERTKGASKDSDLALCLLWQLAFSERPIYLQVGAADKDQAAIIRHRMEDWLYYNPWLRGYVDVQRYSAVNVQTQYAKLDIIAADVAGSHGETPDMLVVNELSHVTKWEFVENLLDNADKVPHGIVVIATNAGFKGTKAEVWRDNALVNKRKWAIRLWQRPAPWIDPGDVADAKKRNSPSRYMRLWYGKWASGKGDALNEDDIDYCLGRHKGPLERPQRGWTYVAGLDLGVSHDHSGLVVVGVDRAGQRIRLAWMRAWEPGGKAHEVDLTDVEATVARVTGLFRLQWVGYDPYEARLMAQRLKAGNVPMREFTFSSGKNINDMAAAMVQVVTSRVLEAYDDEEGRLRRDFGKMNIVERSYGYKLEAVSDEHGHADVGTALAICLPRAVGMLYNQGLQEDDVLVTDEGFEEFTAEELKEAPDDLRDLYGDDGGEGIERKAPKPGVEKERGSIVRKKRRCVRLDKESDELVNILSQMEEEE
jgi:hypothetical protein